MYWKPFTPNLGVFSVYVQPTKTAPVDLHSSSATPAHPWLAQTRGYVCGRRTLWRSSAPPGHWRFAARCGGWLPAVGWMPASRHRPAPCCSGCSPPTAGGWCSCHREWGLCYLYCYRGTADESPPTPPPPFFLIFFIPFQCPLNALSGTVCGLIMIIADYVYCYKWTWWQFPPSLHLPQTLYIFFF